MQNKEQQSVPCCHMVEVLTDGHQTLYIEAALDNWADKKVSLATYPDLDHLDDGMKPSKAFFGSTKWQFTLRAVKAPLSNLLPHDGSEKEVSLAILVDETPVTAITLGVKFKTNMFTKNKFTLTECGVEQILQ